MQHYLPLISVALALLVTLDLIGTIRTGRARGRFSTIHRATRPEAFRRYLIGDALVIVTALGILAWSLTQS